MSELSVKYLGLNLKNPVIAGSSGLTRSLVNLQRLEQSGVAAIVMKSLFEEQVYLDADYNREKAMQENMIYFDNSETFDYIDMHLQSDYLSDYIETIRKAKETVNIPIIASINCISAGEWVSFASRLQDAGADALELNIALQAFNPNLSAADIERVHIEIIEKVRKAIHIPLAVKISPYFADLSRIIDRLAGTGIDGLVLFNRFFNPDINIDTMQVEPARMFSSPSDLSNPLRWIALKSGDVSCDLCASTGVHTGADVIKMLLAGSAAVQVVSTLYNNGLDQVAAMLNEIEDWMTAKGYNYISQFAGMMQQFATTTPTAYERIQFMKYYSEFEKASDGQ